MYLKKPVLLTEKLRLSYNVNARITYRQEFTSITPVFPMGVGRVHQTVHLRFGVTFRSSKITSHNTTTNRIRVTSDIFIIIIIISVETRPLLDIGTLGYAQVQDCTSLEYFCDIKHFLNEQSQIMHNFLLMRAFINIIGDIAKISPPEM